VPGGGVGEAGDVPNAVGEEGGCCGVLGIEKGVQEGVGWVVVRNVQKGEGNCCTVAKGAPGVSKV